MRSVAMITVLLSGLLAGTSLKAENDRTGNYYYKGCKKLANGEPYFGSDTQQNLANAMLMGDCLGVFKTIVSINSFGENKDGTFYCPPKSATIGQLNKITISYMDRYPELLHEPLLNLAFAALGEAWPCKKD